MAVTRMEIADSVEQAFLSPPTSKADLLSTAVVAQARPQVLDVLTTLPEGKYRPLHDLWVHLAEVPVER